jgi:hypothetical protein
LIQNRSFLKSDVYVWLFRAKTGKELDIIRFPNGKEVGGIFLVYNLKIKNLHQRIPG